MFHKHDLCGVEGQGIRYDAGVFFCQLGIQVIEFNFN